MKITQDEVVDNQTTLHIELEDADLAPYLDMGYRRIADRVSIPGFRRGKAPRRVVEQALGREQLLGEVLDSMAYETAEKAIAQTELDAASHPKIERLDMQDAVRITAIVPLSPEVRLGDYRATRIDFDVEEVTEDQVDDQIHSIRESLGTWEKADRPARFGDLTTLTIRAFSEGEEEQGWGMGGQAIYLSENGTTPLEGFSAEIVGAAEGDHLEFAMDVPENHPLMPALSGKRADFSVDVLDVLERIMPDLNDEFAQGLPDGFENLEALRAEVRVALARASDEKANAEYRDLVITALVEGAELELPPVLVEREADHILSEQFGFLESNGIRPEDYLASIGRTEDELREEAETEASRRVTRSLTLNRVAEIENVEATEAEISERFNLMFAGARLKRRERRTRRESLGRSLRIEKTVETLVSFAKGESENGEGADGGESQ